MPKRIETSCIAPFCAALELESGNKSTNFVAPSPAVAASIDFRSCLLSMLLQIVLNLNVMLYVQ